VNFATFGTAANDATMWGTGLTWNTNTLDVDESAFDPTSFKLTKGSIWTGDSGGKASEFDASGNATIMIGDATTIKSYVLSGDVSMTNAGVVTIGDSTVTSAKILDATIENGDLNKTAIPLSGFGSATAAVDLGSQRITNMADGSASNDAVTLQQLESVSAGLNAKESCRYIAVSDMGLNGTSGTVDKDLVAAALDIVDGDAVDATDIVDADRILVVAEGGDFIGGSGNNADVANGIYVWVDDATGLQRAEDFDGSPIGEVASGDFTYVAFGDNAGNAQWVLVEPSGDVNVGTDAIKFSPLAGPASVNAGAGLEKINNILQVDLFPDGGLEFDIPAGTNGSDDPNSRLKVDIDDTGGTNLAASINVSSNGLAVKVDDSTIEEGTSGQLIVKTGGITANEIAVDAVNDTHLKLGESTNEINATTFLTTTAYVSSTGSVSGGTDTVESALEALDLDISGLQTDAAKTGSAIQVAPAGTNGEAAGTVDWDGVMTKDASITGATQSYSVLLGGDGLNVSRLNKFEVYVGAQTTGGELKIANSDGTITLTSNGTINNVAKNGFTVSVNGAEKISATTNIKLTSTSSSIELDDAGDDNVITDGNTDPKGLVYASGTYRTNFENESLVDKKYVDDEIINNASIVELDEFNPYIDVASTSGTDTVIKDAPSQDYTFAFDPLGEVSIFINGLGEARGSTRAWIVVDPNNSYVEVGEGDEKAGDAIQWNNDYFLESDDIVTVRYIRAASVSAGTSGI
ncbi:MAG: hypothetical protein ACC656_02990, partial [Candidatus Heimdallarchaeota archaeon]